MFVGSAKVAKMCAYIKKKKPANDFQKPRGKKSLGKGCVPWLYTIFALSMLLEHRHSGLDMQAQGFTKEPRWANVEYWP